MAKYRVKSLFTLPEKLAVYISGDIIEGVIHTGDTLRIPWNASLRLEGTISDIEFMDRQDSSNVCVVLQCESLDEQEMWLGMNVEEGEVFEVR